MIAIDTDVLAIYYICRWDRRFPLATQVIDSDKTKMTTIINVLELAGLMAIAQSGLRAKKLFKHVHKRKDFKILYWKTWPTQFSFINKTMDYISRKTSFGDAIIGWILEEHSVEFLITWNKKHFKDRFDFEVLTPEEALKEKLF